MESHTKDMGFCHICFKRDPDLTCSQQMWKELSANQQVKYMSQKEKGPKA
jgi:hypothetical protein